MKPKGTTLEGQAEIIMGKVKPSPKAERIQNSQKGDKRRYEILGWMSHAATSYTHYIYFNPYNGLEFALCGVIATPEHIAEDDGGKRCPLCEKVRPYFEKVYTHDAAD